MYSLEGAIVISLKLYPVPINRGVMPCNEIFFPSQRGRDNLISEAVIPPPFCKLHKAEDINVILNFIPARLEEVSNISRNMPYILYSCFRLDQLEIAVYISSFIP